MSEGTGQQATPAASLGQWLRQVLAPGAALVADSRAVCPGDAFVAWQGANHDGRDYIRQAIARGAAAVLYETDADVSTGAVASRPVSGLKSLAGPIAAEAASAVPPRIRARRDRENGAWCMTASVRKTTTSGSQPHRTAIARFYRSELRTR